MPEYLNISNTHLQIAEHKFVPPNATVTLSEEQAAPLMKSGWLVNILTDVASQIVDGELNNFVNGLNHLPPQPIDVNFPLNSVVSHSVAPEQKPHTDEKVVEVKSDAKSKPVEDPPFIKTALERAKIQKAIPQPKKTKAAGVLNQEDVFDSDEFQ